MVLYWSLLKAITDSSKIITAIEVKAKNLVSKLMPYKIKAQ